MASRVTRELARATGDFAALRGEVLGAYRSALAAALPPKPQVARHWETPGVLGWLALLSTAEGFHLSYSLGRLRDVPLVPGQRHTSGLFRLSAAVFPRVDEGALWAAVVGQIPATADRAARDFLLPVVAALAVGEAALALEAAPGRLPLPVDAGFHCHLPLRADALFQAAPTPRLPEAKAERVQEALAVMEPDLVARLQSLFDAPEPSLLEALRRLGAWPR
jgi:hypothetical protein